MMLPYQPARMLGLSKRREMMVYQVGEYEQLCTGQIHLWLTFFDDPRLDGMLDDYRRLLTDDERAQEKKFYFEKDQRRYLVTRALLRCTLSRYVDRDPSAWRFASNEYGRPYIAEADGVTSPLHFNLSHTTGKSAWTRKMYRDAKISYIWQIAIFPIPKRQPYSPLPCRSSMSASSSIGH
jgi:hypothetical protein